MSACRSVVEPHSHLVQLYGADERHLITNVGKYLCEGLSRGEGALVIASPKHAEELAARISLSGIDLDRATATQQLLFLDAAQTLSLFMSGGQPDQERFEEAIRGAVCKLNSQTGRRAYGEMVGLLWEAGQFDAAIRLEELWNGVLGSLGLQLFCGYPIDIFDTDFQGPAVSTLLEAHTHMISTGQDGDLDRALNRAFFEVVGDRVARVENFTTRVAIPKAEATILSLKNVVPDQVGQVLARARQNYQSERHFRALIENSSDGILLTDVGGAILYASASTRRVLGHQAEALTGINAYDLLHPEDAGSAREIIARAIANPDRPEQLETRMRRPEGQWSWLECTISNLLHEASVNAIVWNCRDITERKSAEEVLRASERRLAERERFLALLLDSLPECVKLLGPNGEVLEMNPAGLQMVEAERPEQVIGKCVYPLIDEADRGAFRAVNEGVFQGGKGGTLEFSITGFKGSQRHFETHVVPLRDECANVIGALSATSDVTDRKRAEAALRHANEGLEQFAYAAAHDLQEPIRNVVLYTQLLARRYGARLDDEANRLMSVTVEGARRMQTLVQDLLAFTRSLDRSDNEHASTDAAAVVEEVLSNLRTAIEIAGARVTCESLPRLPASRAHLVQLFQNLIANSLKYRSGENPTVHISAKEQQDSFVISVKDNGIGIPAEHRERIFGVFKRLHGPDIPGNGIGLAICSRIIASYHGRIWVESQPGKGSEFLFALPRTRYN